MDAVIITIAVFARLPDILPTFQGTAQIDNVIDAEVQDDFLPGTASIMCKEPQDAQCGRTLPH